MVFTIGNQNFTEQEMQQLALSLNKNCAKVDAHNYNKFLQNTSINGLSLIDWMREMYNNSNSYKYKESRSLGLTSKKQFALTKEFFTHLDPSLGEKISEILDKKTKQYKLKFIKTENSHAGHHDEKDYIDVEIYLIDKLDNFHQLPHELSHAISGRNTRILEFVDKLKTAKKTKDKQIIHEAETELKDYTRSLGFYNRDCIGEIESHITERLFYRFLLKKKIITKDDYQNYRAGAMNSFQTNLRQIIEEYDILQNLPCPITYNSAMNYIQQLLQDNNQNSKNLLGRLHTMATEKKTPVKAEYAMRYVIAEIVSSEWFKIYKQADKAERKSMKENFVKFLSKTYKLDLEQSCKFLLNKTIGEVFENFNDILITSQQSTTP